MSITDFSKFTLSNIRQELERRLISSGWQSLKYLDVGRSLIDYGSFFIYQTVLACQNSLNQLNLNTVTDDVFLSQLALSNGVVPDRYIPATVSLNLVNNSNNDIVIPPFGSYISLDNLFFYNLDEIRLMAGDSSGVNVVYYCGSLVLFSNKSSSQYSVTVLNTPVSVIDNGRVVYKYFLIPEKIFLDSVRVFSLDYQGNFYVWNRVDVFRGDGSNRDYMLGKEITGEYRVIFGDGVRSKSLPVDEIIFIKGLFVRDYMVSISYSGTGLDGSIVLYSDSNVAYSNVLVRFLSFTSGTNILDREDLKRKIYLKRYFNDRLVTLDSYKFFVDSRDDVLYSKFLSLRDVSGNLIDVNLLNKLVFSVKPKFYGGFVDIHSIISNLKRKGLFNVDYVYEGAKYILFDISLNFSVYNNYIFSEVRDLVKLVLSNRFGWGNIGFDYKLSKSLVYSVIDDGVDGIDMSTLDIGIDYYLCRDNFEEVFDVVSGDELYFHDVPERRSVVMGLGGDLLRDDGFGNIFKVDVNLSSISLSYLSDVGRLYYYDKFLFIFLGFNYVNSGYRGIFVVYDLESGMSVELVVSGVLNGCQFVYYFVDGGRLYLIVRDVLGKYRYYVYDVKFLSLSSLLVGGERYYVYSSLIELDLAGYSNFSLYRFYYSNNYLYVLYEDSGSEFLLCRHLVGGDIISPGRDLLFDVNGIFGFSLETLLGSVYSDWKLFKLVFFRVGGVDRVGIILFKKVGFEFRLFIVDVLNEGVPLVIDGSRLDYVVSGYGDISSIFYLYDFIHVVGDVFMLVLRDNNVFRVMRFRLGVDGVFRYISGSDEVLVDFVPWFDVSGVYYDTYLFGYVWEGIFRFFGIDVDVVSGGYDVKSLCLYELGGSLDSVLLSKIDLNSGVFISSARLICVIDYDGCRVKFFDDLSGIFIKYRVMYERAMRRFNVPVLKSVNFV